MMVGLGMVAPPDGSPGVLGDIVSASYLPTTIEVLVAVGIVAYALLGFTLGARFLPIYQTPKEHTEAGD